MTNQTQRFATPTFGGGRFNSGLLSIDVLPDLAAYRDLVIDLAKHLLLQQRNRKRVPKGFVESFQLGIRAIQSGSVVPVLERIPQRGEAGHMLPLLQTMDYFERARDVITAVVDAAERGDSLPPEFPKELGWRFNQFGRGLRDDEYIELKNPGKTSGPRYNKRIRKRIIIQCIGKYEDETNIVGVLTGGDIDRELIFVRIDDGRRFEGKSPLPIVRQALTTLVEHQVRVIGLGLYDRNEQLERILRVDEVISIADDEADDLPDDDGPLPTIDAPSSLDEQFDDLKRLQDGWFDPDTPALNPEGLEAFRSFLDRALKARGIPRPYMYPTPDAEARAEWPLSDWEVSATTRFGEKIVHVFATHLRNDLFEEKSFELFADDAPEAFAEFVYSLSSMN